MKKFVSIPYFGVFIRGGQCPHDAFHTREMAEWLKSLYEKDDFYKQFNWVVKPCRLGRNLTSRAADASPVAGVAKQGNQGLRR